MTTTIAKFAHLQIPLEDVLKATNNFHDDNIIGHGGFGRAYKGQLIRNGTLMKIAARRLDRKHGEGHVEFWTEISVLSDLKHTNLVSIIGFCDEQDEKIIITTYEANGSLQEHLSNPNLTWMQRLRISVGVARALSYLHYDEGRSYGVIHCNINSASILLDENLEPKLSGFEISIKQAVNRMYHVSLAEPVGTIGYMDPEIVNTKGVTHKSDIYAFGVVLFEILCGRRAYIKNGANRFLARLAKYHYENETLHDIIQHDLRNQLSRHQISLESIKKYSKTAYSCLHEERAHRPHMLNIVDELEKTLEKALKFQPPPENFGKNLEHLKIRLDDIKLVTHNFSNTYRTIFGDFYSWFEAELDYFDKENTSFIEEKNESNVSKRHGTVVIKRFLPRDDNLGEELFFTELEVLTTVKHHKIVTLLGFCSEGFERILVIEKFSNDFLCDYLGNVKNMGNLTWEKRLKICIDGAHALNYLHYEMGNEKMIIHSDIDDARFGLDENWGAKIEDFELAVFVPPNQKDGVLCKRTDYKSKYHVDPEYAETGRLKRESDVYSFGVVLFEIVCGRHAYDQIYLKESEKGLVHVARQNFYNGTIMEMIDPTLKKETDQKSYISNRGVNKDSLHIFLKVANQCVAETHDQRPTMKVVLKELEEALAFQEELVQQPSKDQVVNEDEKTTHEIPVEPVQQMGKDQVVDILERATHEILEKNLDHLKISLVDIQFATESFSNTYKITPFGDDYDLYRTELNYYDKENHSSKRRNTVLIKRYHSGNKLYGAEEFFTEIKMLSCVKHPNIVTLVGFCVEASEMILVVDNFSHEFLGQCLTNIYCKRILTWEKRLKICIDVAKALNYIHSEMEDQNMIINRDIRSYNIGLDENWGAKIVHFWWSVLLPTYQKVIYHNQCLGKVAYIDPEYEMTGKLKRESDVYSFGVVLFEILCGRISYDPIYMKESDEGLAVVARQSFCKGILEVMIDPILKEETSVNNFVLKRGPNKNSLHTFMRIAYQCVAKTQDERPTMELVVKELQKALLFQENNKDNPKILLEEIKLATQNFHNDNCIGRGGFGKVYKGNLQSGDGFKTIVAKRLDTRSGQGEQQFLSEVQILLEYKHENVIGLVGYCDENNEKIIVYDYAPKGSLDRYLNDVSLTWAERLNICIDVASALYFCHEGDGKQAKVIHRDIKSTNILLHNDWKAKLADFGLSLLSPLTHETDYVIDHACGTPGYLDPVYRKSGLLTIESDIYSFGVVLFELLCGRSTLVIDKHEGHYLPDFIKNKFEEGKHDEVVFEKIKEHIEPKSLTTFQNIAYQCLHPEREQRPKTKKVLMQLKKALAFQNLASTMTKFATLRIPLEDIIKATNNFHDDNIIRHDEFGTTYKGQLLRFGKLMEITARRFDRKHLDGDLMFLNEISVLSDLKHTNLVSIIGFCDEKYEKIIVTTYEANGSLRQYLSNPNLTWEQRLRICVGVARALSYFYIAEGRDYAIIHCNINCDTILLDNNWEAKLSSFEFSIKQSESTKHEVHISEHTSTMGCMDPEFEKTGGVTHKSDIYSFGVVLFETIIQNDADRSLAPLAKYHFENRTLHDIIPLNLLNQISSQQSLLIYSKVAYSCLNESGAHRPDMHFILAKLEKALELQLGCENIEKKLKHLKIHLSDIKLATNDFSDTSRIGTDMHYTCYNGELDCFNHNTVLIKRIIPRDDEQGEEVFHKEIEMLSSVKHRCIYTLLGFCIEGSEMILITEKASNGYLCHYLRKENGMHILTWEKRLKICINVAQALKFLHSQMEDRKMIIHRDINSLRIGLFQNWEAKIASFWLSTFIPLNQEDEALHHNMYAHIPLYNKFYTDPEYVKTGNLNRELDVYSFGVVLFEILCGKLARDPIYVKESEKGLASVAQRCFSTGTLEDMIDPIIMEGTHEENNSIVNRGPNKDSLHTFIEIAYQCVAETQVQRPKMEVVVNELEKALFYQIKGGLFKRC